MAGYLKAVKDGPVEVSVPGHQSEDDQPHLAVLRHGGPAAESNPVLLCILLQTVYILMLFKLIFVSHGFFLNSWTLLAVPAQSDRTV